MSKYIHSFSPINLALDGSLEQFVELYNFTYRVYADLSKRQESFNVEVDSYRQMINDLAIPKLVEEFDNLLFRRKKIFSANIKSIKMVPEHFEYFSFFDSHRVGEFAWKKEFYEELVEAGYSTAQENKYLNKNPEFILRETVVDLEHFLDEYRRVVLTSIWDEIRKTDPAYTIFQARKDVDKSIETRIRKRKDECIVNDEYVEPTNEPLFLYDALNSTSCKREKHRFTPRKYYAKNIDGKMFALPVHYCDTCHRYICGTTSFSLLTGYFGRLIVDTRNYYQKINGSWELDRESRLHKLGYNVIEGKLSVMQRRNILINVLEGNQLSFFDIVATIEQNIRMFKTNDKMRNAVEKWKEDLKFINKYVLEKKTK